MFSGEGVRITDSKGQPKTESKTYVDLKDNSDILPIKVEVKRGIK